MVRKSQNISNQTSTQVNNFQSYILKLKSLYLSSSKNLHTLYNHNETWEIMKMVYESEPPEDLEEEKPLLTLFTSFKDFTKFPHHKFAHLLCILNWSSFGKLLRPVLFTDDPQNLESEIDSFYSNDKKVRIQQVIEDILNNKSLAYIAYKSGWSLLKLKHRNEFGTPFLKNMFAETFDKYDSWFYGFANGDLLFDRLLIDTLTTMRKKYLEILKFDVFIIGRRTNVNLYMYNKTIPTTKPKTPKFTNKTDRPTVSEKLEKITKDTIIVKEKEETLLKSILDTFYISDFQDLLKKKGKLGQSYAEDYFITNKQGSRFNWNKIENVVIGRVGYDNYLVAEAKKFNVSEIDCTNTIRAVHLAKPGVPETGRQNKDSSYNIKLIGNYDWNSGLTGYSPFESQLVKVHDQILLDNKENVINIHGSKYVIIVTKRKF